MYQSSNSERDVLVLSNDEGKRCQKCGRLLPLSHFHRCTKTNDTYQSWCKTCQNDYKAYRRSRMTAIKEESKGKTLSDIIELVNGGNCTGTMLNDYRASLMSAVRLIDRKKKRK